MIQKFNIAKVKVKLTTDRQTNRTNTIYPQSLIWGNMEGKLPCEVCIVYKGTTVLISDIISYTCIKE